MADNNELQSKIPSVVFNAHAKSIKQKTDEILSEISSWDNEQITWEHVGSLGLVDNNLSVIMQHLGIKS